MKNNATCTIRSKEITIDVVSALRWRQTGAVRSTSQPLPRIWN